MLDPACGSGNFLYVAYREMKRLERELLVRLRDAGERPERLVSAIALTQFFGLDVVPFAVELARVTLMLAKELELHEAKKTRDADDLLVFEKPLPLDNLDQQIVCADALFTDWPAADAIIGNPPYLGSRYLAKEHGYDYARRLHERFAEAPKMADFCTHWFRLAHDALPAGGRAGLVGTNTIRQNESRVASLDYVLARGGVITEAVSTQVWSGDAAVHVSIVNWEKDDAADVSGRVGVPPAGAGILPERTSRPGMDSANPAQRRTEDRLGETPKPAGGTPTLPATRRLTFQRGDSVDSPWETFELPLINPALSIGTDVSEALSLAANQKPKAVYVGQYPFNEGFLLTPDEAAAMIHAEPKSREVLFPYMIGRDLVEKGGPTRWSIDFGQKDVFFARTYAVPFDRVKERVMPEVIAQATAEKAKTGKATTRWTRVAQRWWQFRDYQPGTIAAIKTVPRYIAVSRVTKRPIFEFVSSCIRPDNTIVVFPFADDYSFGILQSDTHWRWFKARCSTLGGTFRYTSDTVFDTFPWPQSPTRAQIAAVAAAAVALRALRREIMGRLKYSLRELYRTLDDAGANPLRDAHARLDTAVRAAYGLPEKISAAPDPLAFLLALNLELAARESRGEPITPPGLPLPDSERSAILTEDCISVAEP